MKKRWIAALIAAASLLGLAGCGDEPDTFVYVQKVEEIVGKGSLGVNDKFAGVVVSENATKVNRDYSRTISMLYVTEGQDVVEGDVLFTYDSEALQLELDKQNLELERLQQNATTLQNQITQLQNEQKKASKDEQLSYTVNIQERQAQLKENEYNMNAKKKEIAQTQNTLANAKVTAPISGRIISISNEEYSSDAYITIQQAGTYRVKGSMNELSMGSVFEGTPIRVTARTDETMTWNGVVSLIDLEGGQTNNGGDNFFGGPVDEYSSTTKYPFYVELDSTDGLMLGQHVYMQIDDGTLDQEGDTGLWLPAYYVTYEEAAEDSETVPDAYVWADNGKDRLEKRIVVLGEFDEMKFAYEILEGLSVEDYIAFPDANCAPEVGTTRNPDEATPLEWEEDPEYNPDDNWEDFDPEGGWIEGDPGFNDDPEIENWPIDATIDDDWSEIDPDGYESSPTPPQTTPAATTPSATVSGGTSSDGDLEPTFRPISTNPSTDGDLGG